MLIVNISENKMKFTGDILQATKCINVEQKYKENHLRLGHTFSNENFQVIVMSQWNNINDSFIRKK